QVRAHADRSHAPLLELLLPMCRHELAERRVVYGVGAPGTAHLDEQPSAHERAGGEHRLTARGRYLRALEVTRHVRAPPRPATAAAPRCAIRRRGPSARTP